LLWAVAFFSTDLPLYTEPWPLPCTDLTLIFWVAVSRLFIQDNSTLWHKGFISWKFSECIRVLFPANFCVMFKGCFSPWWQTVHSSLGKRSNLYGRSMNLNFSEHNYNWLYISCMWHGLFQR
jgi:hypothetical protein